MSIGKTITRLREQRGWTQGQLAVRTGIAATYIGRIEHDVHQTINARNLGKFAVALGVSTDYMMVEAGWIPDTAPATTTLGIAEQQLIDTIREVRSENLRRKLLEQFTWIAEVARDADLARQPALKLVAESKKEYEEGK